MRVSKPVTLDAYIAFLQNPQHHDFTVKHLNQIIQIHGFCKIHRRPKEDLLEAFATLELLSPFRSTTKEIISCSAVLTKEEMSMDLGTLGWQEYCSVKSIETVGGSGSGSAAGNENQNQNHQYPAVTSNLRCLTMRQQKRMRKRKKKEKLKRVFLREGAAKWGAKRKRNSINGAVPVPVPVPVPDPIPLNPLSDCWRF